MNAEIETIIETKAERETRKQRIQDAKERAALNLQNGLLAMTLCETYRAARLSGYSQKNLLAALEQEEKEIANS